MRKKFISEPEVDAKINAKVGEVASQMPTVEAKVAAETTRAKGAEDSNAQADATRATAQAGKDATQDAVLAKIGAPEILSGISTAAAAFAYTFPTAYKTAPFVDGRDTWAGDTLIKPAVTNITATGCTVIVKRSKGTLLLSAGPFEQAPSGTAFQLNVWGTKAS